MSGPKKTTRIYEAMAYFTTSLHVATKHSPIPRLADTKNQPLLVMRSCGEPQSTTVKVVTSNFFKNAKTDQKIACFWALLEIAMSQTR